MMDSDFFQLVNTDLAASEDVEDASLSTTLDDSDSDSFEEFESPLSSSSSSPASGAWYP